MAVKEFGDNVQGPSVKDNEKHLLLIDCPDQVKAGELFQVKLGLAEGVSHPSTTEHHIVWISLYFTPDGDPFIKDVGRLLLNTHGGSVAGPNKGPVYADPAVTMSLKISKPGMLYAVSYCNIHGLSETQKPIGIG